MGRAETTSAPPPKTKGEGKRQLAATRRRLLTTRRGASSAATAIRGRELKKSGKSGKDCTTYYYDCYYPEYTLD